MPQEVDYTGDLFPKDQNKNSKKDNRAVYIKTMKKKWDKRKTFHQSRGMNNWVQ